MSYFSNESIEDLWIRNPYYQYFCIEAEFQWHFPCYPSDLVHFRKRIGEEGVELIFKMSIDVQQVRANMKSESDGPNAEAELPSSRLSDM